ncbi:NACHT domain-containing protein [Humibacter ginsenosidimutans]|uniref:NACHT domain-containing protein n=1 Tax=Humibacter ginsenosidimutans TaxID=2599293 RepID=A0A5B8M2T1_9MICO|nr:NACHT domain-containing protein [Humibacter ginsenosidimutans]QDZ14576.1 NACHT domain-containing protein [Humibacter ginsenosidimutans]
MTGDALESAAVAGVVDRPRLYRILDSTLVRVCIVQGPSGSGKTTLLRSWATKHESDRTVTWVSLGQNTTSVQAFWRHVANCAKRLGRLTPEAEARVSDQLNVAADPVQVAVTLLADLGEVTLVLDAYEQLGDALPEVDRDLTRLLSALPELRIMITTRSGTALTEVRAPGGVVRVLTLADLALTLDEVDALIVAQTGIQDRRLAHSVMTATHGFALTVRSVVLVLAQLGRVPRVDSTEWDAVVAARLESLLPDDVTMQFVVDTSVPPYVDADLASRLSGHPDPARLLDTLEHNGFGRWIPYGCQHPVFQYVETIRDTFRTRAAEDREGFRRSCITTARWLFGNDDVDQALRFAIDGGDYALADRVFVSLVINNPDTYITDRFLPTLRDIPEPVLSEHPMLAFGLGLALHANAILRLEAPRVFRIAIDSTARPAYLEPTIDAFSMNAMQAIARREAFAFRDSARACLDVVRSMDAIDPGLLTRYGEHVGTILRQLSYSLLLGGEIDEAIAAIRRSVALCTSQTTRNYSIVYAAGASAFAGDIVRSTAFLDSIDGQAWPQELRHTYLNGLGVVATAFAQLDSMDFAAAAETLRQADSYTPTSEFWPFFTAISVSARHGLGQAQAEAARVTRELSDPTPPGIGDSVATEHLYATLARAWLAAGDRATADRLLREQPEDSPYLAGARIAALLAAGDDRGAFALAEQSIGLRSHTLRTRADVGTTGAVAALRIGRDDLAWSWLNGASVTWESYGPRMHVALLPPRDRELLREFERERHSASIQSYLDIAAPTGQAGTVAVPLTSREHVVLNALAEHGSIKEAAAALVVSPHTVKTQSQSLYRKLGVSSRQAALAVARELGLLE